MTQLISLHSYRGGTGKSNFTANLAWWLARSGKSVGVVDTDLQSPGVHMVFEFDTARLTFTLSDFLFGRCEVDEAAYDISRSVDLTREGDGRLMLLPSSMTVESITRILSEGYDVGKLNESLGNLGETLGLDLILIDTHPGLNRETMLTIAVSDLQLILVRPDTQDFHGTAVLLEVARRLNVPRTRLVANKVVSALNRDEMDGMVQDAFKTSLLGCVPLSEEMAALGSRGLISRRSPEHPIAREFEDIAARVIAELEEPK